MNDQGQKLLNKLRLHRWFESGHLNYYNTRFVLTSAWSRFRHTSHSQTSDCSVGYPIYSAYHPTWRDLFTKSQIHIKIKDYFKDRLMLVILRKLLNKRYLRINKRRIEFKCSSKNTKLIIFFIIISPFILSKTKEKNGEILNGEMTMPSIVLPPSYTSLNHF